MMEIRDTNTDVLNGHRHARDTRHGVRRIVVTALMFMTSLVVVRAQINADQVVNIGRNALYFEDYMVAIQYFNQAIRAKPYLAKPYFYRAIAKLNLEDYKGAEEDASKAIELNEFITDAWEVRGVARQNMGDNRGAIDDYTHALSLVPRNRQLLFNIAVAKTEVKDFDSADSTFNRLLTLYPGFENGYLGRARLSLARGDTIAALADINTALEKNDDSFNGHVMRAELLMRKRRPDFDSALVDMDRAVRLEPRSAGLYINRAYIRYNLNDWNGAMDDYDYALTLEPLNRVALFNRGLLNAEVEANDRALQDFSGVLAIDPDNTAARYNRAVVLAKKRDFDGAVADADEVIKAFPEFPTGYFLRSDFERQRGNMASAGADYDRAMALTRKLRPVNGKVDAGNSPGASKEADLDPEELTRRQFASLLTVEDNTDMRDEYNNTAIRGRVQDRNVAISPSPMVELSYYTSPTELNPNTYYIKEVDDLNMTRQLRFVIFVTVAPPVLADEETIASHFNSIGYYNSYLASHTPRAIDFVGRAMDFITVRDYASAIRDLDRAIAMTPDYPPAYMMRAQARFRLHDADGNVLPENAAPTGVKIDAATRAGIDRKILDDIIADIDRAIDLSPNNAFAHYNKAVVLIEMNNWHGAEEELNRALDIKTDFGEAFYNRGYVRLKTGRRAEGLADLSRAGELGVVAAYNLIKRLSH